MLFRSTVTGLRTAGIVSLSTSYTMPIRSSPSRSRAEYTTYSFTASAAIDYNYDPSGTHIAPNHEAFDPYSDDTSSSPLRDPLRQSPASDPAAPPPLPIPPAMTPTTPSPQYLAESQKPSTQLPTPSASRKLLILDLNGTLVYRTPHVRREFRPRRRRPPHYNNNGRYPDLLPEYEDDPYVDPTAAPGPRPLRTVHARPYMRSFREYLLHPRTRAWLDTMVWSSAQPHSVADMVDNCFGSRRDELVAVWARDTLGLEEKDYHRKTQTTKDLARPWSKLRLPLRPSVAPSLSPSPSPSSSSSSSSLSPSSPSTPTPQAQAQVQAHSAHTTLLLDDSPRKAHLQPYNHLCIREYSGTLRNADLQVRAAERRGEAHIVSSMYTSLGDGGGAGGAGILPNPISTPPPIEGMDTKKRKRTKPKHTPPSSSSSGGGSAADFPPLPLLHPLPHPPLPSAPDSPHPAHASSYPGTGYDTTLLAVIGVLERIKWEANVAGWMRAGGLRTAARVPPKVQGQVQGKGKGKTGSRAGSVVVDAAGAGVGTDVATKGGGGNEMKRRRVEVLAPAGEGEYPGRELEGEVEGAGDVAGPGTGPGAELEGGGGVGGEVPPAVSPGDLGDTGQWFEDAAALGHWVRAGVRALEGLGVEVWPGVEG